MASPSTNCALTELKINEVGSKVLANDFMRQYVSHDNKDFDDDYNQ
jgi:hypothetical protein